jgi:hypothetical protein
MTGGLGHKRSDVSFIVGPILVWIQIRSEPSNTEGIKRTQRSEEIRLLQRQYSESLYQIHFAIVIVRWVLYFPLVPSQAL